MTVQLPPSYSYGFAACQAVRTIADTPEDQDRLPQAIPDSGRLTFRPKIRNRTNANTFITHEVYEFDLDASGYLVDDNGLPGVGLIAGEYTVSFALVYGKIDDIEIEITSAHTVTNPLQLASVRPEIDTEKTTVQTILLPGTAIEGGIFRWINGQAAWVLPDAGSGVAVTWDTLDHPETFPPSAHSHTMNNISDIGNKVVTVPTGATGFTTQPNGTLWVEYTP